jgi:hypothetical protein
MRRVPSCPPGMPKYLVVLIAIIFVGLEMISCGGGSVGKNGAGPPSAKPEVVYVSSATTASGEILAFNITSSGVGTPKAFQAPVYIFDLKADATSTFLYAADFDAGNIAAYSINSSTGALATVNGSPFSSSSQFGNGGPLAVSANGKFLFSSEPLRRKQWCRIQINLSSWLSTQQASFCLQQTWPTLQVMRSPGFP